MCPTSDMSKDYEFIPNKNVFNEYDESILKEIIDTQKGIIKKFGKKRTPFVLVVLDDCIELVGSFSYINQVITKIRHYNVYLLYHKN